LVSLFDECMQEANAEADALSNLSAMSDAARGQDQNSSGSTGSSSSKVLGSKAESDLDTDDTDDHDAVRAADKQALKEVRHYQRMTNRLMCKFAFTAVAGDVLQQQAGAEFSFDSEAVDVLQRACESYLVDAFDASVVCAAHAGRQKVTVEDLQLADRLSGGWRNVRGPAGG
jgi:histone H3/H4